MSPFKTQIADALENNFAERSLLNASLNFDHLAMAPRHVYTNLRVDVRTRTSLILE